MLAMIGDKGENLIFIISQPRAGSTLLQQILGNHPEIHITAEPWIMLPSLYALRPEGHEAEYDSNLARLAIINFLQTFPNGEMSYFEGIRRMHSYLYKCALVSSGKSYFLDKTPRYYHIIPDLYNIFPAAKFIILLRNPLSVLCSIIKTWIKSDWFLLQLYQYDLLKAPQLLLEGIKLLGEDKCLVLHYEKLIINPKNEVKRICDWIDVEFLIEMLKYNPNEVHRNGYGFKDQTSDAYNYGKPDPQNLDKWISLLKEPQTWRTVSDYLNLLGRKTVNEMGYSYEKTQRLINDRRPHWLYIKNTFPMIWLFKSPQGYQRWNYLLLKLGKKMSSIFSNKQIHIK